MSLLAILFSLAIERYVEVAANIRNYDWSIRFTQWTKDRFSQSEYWNDTAGLIIILLIPFFACAIIYDQLFDVLGLLGFLFSLAVLVYCIRPKRSYQLIRQYLDASEHEDQHSLLSYASDILQQSPPQEDAQLHRSVSERLLNILNNEVLAVFFWFVVLGPMGALLFRMTATLYEDAYDDNQDETEAGNDTDDVEANYTEFNNSIRILYAILLWLPTQISLLCFAIAGSFIDTLQTWKNRLLSDYLNPDESDITVVQAGFSALQFDEENNAFDSAMVNQVYALAFRALIVWITALALLTLAGLTG